MGKSEKCGVLRLLTACLETHPEEGKKGFPHVRDKETRTKREQRKHGEDSVQSIAAGRIELEDDEDDKNMRKFPFQVQSFTNSLNADF